MKRVNVIGVVNVRRVADKDRMRIAIKLMWIPGVKPVIVPKKMPRIRAIKNSITIRFIIYVVL